MQPFATKSRGFHQCSGKIIVCQSMQNLYQLVKYSLIKSQNWIHVYERHHTACEHDTSNSWRSTANKDFGNWKNDWVSSKTVEMAYMLFDLLRITVYLLSGRDRRRLEW